MDEQKASAMLLPSAALDVTCPSFALAKAGEQGLERALSVALAWSCSGSAKELHQRLCVASKGIVLSESRAKALCDKFLAKRSKATAGNQISGQADSTAALFESLVLSSVVKSVKRSAKGAKPAL